MEAMWDVMKLFAVSPVMATVRVPYGEAPQQFGDLFLPERGTGPFPAVIAIHGGFGRNSSGLEHLSHLCQSLTRDGIAVWSLEYRRLGDPGGGWPGTFQDVA